MTASLVEIASAGQLGLMTEVVAHIFIFGPHAAAVATAAKIAITFNYAESKRNTAKLFNKNNEDNPIDVYLNSKTGAWAAHLVPCSDKP